MGRCQDIQFWKEVSALKYDSMTTESRLLNWELLGSIRICIIAAIYSKAISKSMLHRPCISAQAGGIFYN